MDISQNKDNFVKFGDKYMREDGEEMDIPCPSRNLQFLKLSKSRLSLYSDGLQRPDNEQKAEINTEKLFPELNAFDVLPSSEDSVIVPHPCDNSFQSHIEPEAEIEDLLVSMSNIHSKSDMDHDRPKQTEKGSGLAKICGLNDAKNMLRNILIYPVLYPHFFPENVLWNQVLLYGPPGTGKSLLAEAMAEEIDACLYKVSSADLLSHWHGETEKKIRSLFEEARSADCPIVLFFDEIDGLCRSRNSSENDSVRRIKTELLQQFESYRGPQNNRVYLVGATNCPWDIDSAFLRRFQKKIYISLPEKSARIQILKQGFEGVETDLSDAEWEQVGVLTEGYSGSDLINVVMCSCCERLTFMMNCQYWKSNGQYWIPVDAKSVNSVRINFKYLQSRQVHCRPIILTDIEAAVLKTPKSISDEELLKFTEYGAKYA